MKVTKNSVVINDYDKDLLALLKVDYDERIAEIKRVAQAERVSLLEENMMNSRKKEDARMERALKKKKRALAQAEISKTHSELQKQNEKKEAYLKEGIRLVEKELRDLDEKAKVALTKVLFEELKVNIAEAGYKVKDFVFFVYKGADINNTKPVLSNVSVIAEKDAIRFFDSLKNRLKEKELALKEVLIGSLK